MIRTLRGREETLRVKEDDARARAGGLTKRSVHFRTVCWNETRRKRENEGNII